MFTLTVPFAFGRFTLRLDFERPPSRPQPQAPPPLTRVQFRERFRRELSPHLLRDVGLEDSRQ
jgi:hypothetical protein